MDTRQLQRSVVALVWLLGGCVTAVPPVVSGAPEPPPGIPATPAPSTAPTLNWSILPLEPTSRRLLAVLDPGEEVSADIDSPDAERLARSASSVGLSLGARRDDVVNLRGDVTAIGSLLDPGRVRSIELREDESALRFIPDTAPTLEVPVPGGPYVLFGLPSDLISFRAPNAARESLIRDLAARVRSIDGRPYDIVQLPGSCEGVDGSLICTGSLTGVAPGAVRDSDEWTATVTQRAGWAAMPMPAPTTLTSVPRQILRAAEWVARHDPAALHLIRGYTTCCSSWWNPAAPGRITVFYTRDCAMSIERPGTRVADTGDCVDGLEIVVDLRTASVVRVTEHAGP